MAFNLLLESDFTSLNRWKFTNCKYENGYLISNDKVFGIEQELILPDITKLYFRVLYQAFNPELFDVKIGIQNNDLLEVNEKLIKKGKEDFISLVDTAKQEKIKLRIIFESSIKENKVLIKEPLLINLEQLHKSTWVKWLLDKTIKYMKGYNYINLYHSNAIDNSIEDFKNIQLDKAKTGSIISTKQKIQIPLIAKFIKDNYYIVKLDYKEINKLGNVYFNYGVLKSSKIDDEQCYLLFRANDKNNLELTIEGDNILPYLVNLKHIMIIDITHLRLMKEDVGYLPFI